MNLTQKFILLVGTKDVLREALDVIKGFKACTIVANPNDDIVVNVYKHNKNVVYGTDKISNLDLVKKYNPIVVKVSKDKTDFSQMLISAASIMDDFPTLMDNMDIDVGDHIVHDSAGVKTNTCDCMVCRIAEHRPVREKEHILYESNNFFVVPGLGAFFEGYVMICPKRHVMSFAELDAQEFEEFLRVLDDMKYIISSIYGKEIFAFECGSGKNGGGKHATSITHAHFHICPTDMPVLKCVQKTGIHPGLISPEDLSNYGNYPYMLYIDQSNNWFIASDPDSYFPRQHPRQVIADYMGLAKGEYNWRIYKHENKMDLIATQIYNWLKETWDYLPKWIQNNCEAFVKTFTYPEKKDRA